MFSRCYHCFRPVSTCLCADIKKLDTGIKFIILMHPKEAYHQKTGTGRLTSLSLKDSEILVGIDFTQHERLNELISGSGTGLHYQPFILYPADDAYYCDSPEFISSAASEKTPLIIIIDATWFFAKKMLILSRNLHALPKISFKASYRSQFQFKKQPAPECLSTIESVYYLLKECKLNNCIPNNCDPDQLMVVFQKMVSYQLACEQERHEKEALEIYPDLFH